MSIKRSGRLAWVGAGVLVLAAAGAWQLLRPAPDDGSFVRGNGRIEATEVDVAAKTPGRVDEILVNEGDFVTRADVIARMDVKALQAQLAQARAEVANAHSARETARKAMRPSGPRTSASSVDGSPASSRTWTRGPPRDAASRRPR